MEDDNKILKLKYLSNHIWNHTQILNLSLDDQTIFYKSLRGRWPSLEDDLRCKDDLKASRILVLRGKYKEKAEEISSVALLSPACFAVCLGSKVVYAGHAGHEGHTGHTGHLCWLCQ